MCIDSTPQQGGQFFKFDERSSGNMEPAGSAKGILPNAQHCAAGVSAQLRTGANQHQQLLNQPFIKQGPRRKIQEVDFCWNWQSPDSANNSLHEKL